MGSQQKELESLKKILIKQPPLVNGKPYKMLDYLSDLPKNCGDPWKGAYSKHGFWYKFREASKADLDKLVANSCETDNYHLNYENYEIWKKIFQEYFRLVIAGNSRDESMGGIGFCLWDDYVVLGCYYVMENYRSSGIGEKLFRDAFLWIDEKKTIVFHTISHLAPKVSRFGLKVVNDWTFDHYMLSNPNGYLSLQKAEVLIENFVDLDEDEVKRVLQYDIDVTSLKREKWIRNWMEHSQGTAKVAFNKNQNVVGICQYRETAGGHVKRILVGPLYANSIEIAAQLLFSVFEKLYNPEEDYDFDPDIYAIYRREVHFIIPRMQTEMVKLLEEFAGSSANVKRERLFYRVLVE